MKQRGFSLIEVLVFVTVLSFFFVATASVIAFMLKQAKINERKIMATRYSQELYEWLRAEKEIDWNAFSARAPVSPATTEYCFNSLAWTSGACPYVIDTLFRRTVTLSSLNDGNGYKFQVNADIRVEWQEAGKVYSVPINTTFSVWER